MSGVDSLYKSFAFAGAAFALLLAVLALLLLPKAERRRARASFLLIGVHLAFRLIERRVPHGEFSGRVFAFIASFALFAAIARSGFLLAVYSALARRFTRPWPRIVHDLLQAVVYIAVALLALSAVGVEPGSLLTTSALLTAVIGLSLQDTLGNLFAGLALQAQPPFSIGDWVRYAEGPNGIGRVVEINWRATHLVTVSEVEVIVPNGVMAKAPLYNYSRPTRITRCDTHVILPITLAPELARRLCLRAIENVPGVKREPLPAVIVGDFGERGVDYSVRYFIEDYSRRDLIESDVRQRLWYAFERENIRVPAPRRHIEQLEPKPTPEQTTARQRELMARLAKVNFLTDAGPELLERLVEGTRLVAYTAGEAVVRQGDDGDELFVIERGSLDVFVTAPSSTELRVATLEAGTTFGEAALLHGTQRTATVVSAEECQLLAITGRAFRAAAELDPGIQSRLQEELAARLDTLSRAVTPAEGAGALDDDRRSDLLIERIRQFFAR